MKKIVIAPDSFKGTMNSIEICDIVERGIKNVFPEAETVKVPIADGGEGTVDAFLEAVGGTRINIKVKDPLMREIDSFYGILNDKKTAVIEMAAASGLPLLSDEEKNPSLTSTYGTGQLMLDALEKGCSRIILGLGGSATNDGGIGMAAALGVKFLDKDNNEIPLNGGGLKYLHRIDVSGKDPRLEKCEIIAACDVDNPLYGPNGAACVFSPQKGADEEMVKMLDDNLKHYAEVIQNDFGITVQDIPGTGAAGGIGAALVAFMGARLESGIKIILDCVNFDNLISGADLIITGEGKIDGQSLRGKVPVGIAGRALKQGVPVIAVVGNIGDDIDAVYDKGISAVFCTSRKPVPFDIAKLHCREDLLATIESIMRYTKAIQFKR
ncbi:MAG TPA: glycerate kinase [Clostridiaceae bacterium]|nr:glycerate kinase [Clostridiaceae bacterium]